MFSEAQASQNAYLICTFVLPLTNFFLSALAKAIYCC